MADLTQIVLPNGSTYDFKDALGRKEAYLEWGGKNFTGSYGCIDAAMVSDLNANRFSFLKKAGITIEYTRDGGTTWTDYAASEVATVGLFNPGNSFLIGKADSTNKATANGTNYQLRITINAASASIYTYITKVIIYCSTNGSADCKCQIFGTLKPSTDYTKITDPVAISGWSGYNVIQTGFTIGNSFDGQYSNVRFLFTANGGNTTYAGLTILQILGFGGVGWTTPSTMAKLGHLYSYDGLQNATFPATVTATKFIGPLQGNAATATTATKVGTATVGATRQPIYLSSGTATAGNYIVSHLGNAGKSNMNDIGRMHSSAGMTNLSDPSNTTDNPMNGTTKSTGWHLYWDTNYIDDPNGSNSWVSQICNKAGTAQWWVRSRNGSTITNGTAWAAGWEHLVVAPQAGQGGTTTPIYVDSNGHTQSCSYTIAKSVPSDAVFTDHYAWSDITGKPSTFTPSAHNHSEIVTVGDQRSTATTPNDYSNHIIYKGLKTNTVIGSPSTDTYSYLVGLRGWSDSSGGNSHELAFNNSGIYARNGATTSWGSWQALGRFTATPTTGQVVITDGTTGGIKSSGYTIAKSVPSTAVFTDTNNAVTQTATSDNKSYRILFSGTNDDTTRTEGARKASTLKYNPSSDYLYAGNLSTTANIFATGSINTQSNISMQNSDNNRRALLWVGGNDDGVLTLYNSSGTDTINIAGHGGKITCAELSSSNDSITVSKMMATAFNSAIAVGSYEAQSTTVPNLVNELRYSNGCCGSVSITTAYAGNPDTIATGWYNFLWIPHRSGGKNGAANGDNTNYGRLLLFGMTVNNEYAIRYSGSSITYCRRFLMANGVNYASLYSGSLTTGNQTSVANGYGTYTGYLVIGTLTGTDVRSCVYVPKANLTTSAIRYQYADESDYRSFQLWYSSSTLYIKSDAGSNASGAVKYVYGIQ